MNSPTPAVFTLLMAACTPAVFAASTTDVSVTGIITPSSCTPTLSEGGVVDHGKLTVKDLDRDQPTRLPVGEMNLAVHCEGATFFTLSTVDNRSGSSAINPVFHGLGKVNEDQDLGSVAFGVFEPIADSVPVTAIMSRDGGGSWGPSSYLGHAALTSFAAPGDTSTPIAMQDLSARLRAFTIVVPASDLTLLDEVPIDGHATLQLKYW